MTKKAREARIAHLEREIQYGRTTTSPAYMRGLLRTLRRAVEAGEWESAWRYASFYLAEWELRRGWRPAIAKMEAELETLKKSTKRTKKSLATA